ncbi:hypothetical protein Cni_G10004 [Canna indica]|uniref:Plastocyanin-like domain-containing protein n=1 Tax=Canna indica TaxID=4628 RepID=A0AAQ3Q9Y7_9LILI|nr:hypothetical protein Cni_G10004 [Canna indica]
MSNVTRLCNTKSIVTINGQFPGPKIVAREGDRVVIRVVNHVPYNVTLHWHGVRQLRSGWADGPAYVTQCPIQTGYSYILSSSVKAGKTYLLRLINAALNDELFFSIANHTVAIVEVDAVYVKPFETNTLPISPGQTTNVLLRAKSTYPNALFLIHDRQALRHRRRHVR